MSRYAHAFVPGGVSTSPASVDDRIRPSLRLAFPLPEDDLDHAFYTLLDALARRTGHAPRPATT